MNLDALNDNSKNNNMSFEELNVQLERLKKGDFIYLSTWYGGKNKGGYNGYLVEFTGNSIYEFECNSSFDTKENTHASIKKIISFSDGVKQIFKLYVKNQKLFYFDKMEKLVFDFGTTIELCIDNIKSEIINADNRNSNGKFVVYDDLKEIIEYVINNSNNVEEHNQNNSHVEKESVFTTFDDSFSFEELLLLRKRKIQQCYDKINKINLDDNEKENEGYLFFNTKMIISNIQLIDSKLINKFANNLEPKMYMLIKDECQKLEEKKFVNIDDVLNTLNSIIEINNV